MENNNSGPFASLLGFLKPDTKIEQATKPDQTTKADKSEKKEKPKLELPKGLTNLEYLPNRAIIDEESPYV